MENIKLRGNSEQKDLVIKEGIKEPEVIQPIPEEINEEIVEVDTRIQKNQGTITNTTQNIERLRNELGLSGEGNMIPSIKPNKIGIVTLEDKKKKLQEILKKIPSVAKLAKIATVSAGLFMATENMSAQNNGGDKIDKKETQTEKVSNNEVKAKELEGITVYGVDKSRKELQKQQEDIKRYLEEMNRYKQDSIEWDNTNQAYQDSLNIYNKAQENELRSEKESINPPKFIESVPYEVKKPPNNFAMSFEKNDISYTSKQEAYGGDKIKPIGFNKYGWSKDNVQYEPIYQKPIKPIAPTKPEAHIIPEVKYDPTYEDLKMKSLWANIVKYNPNEKIGTLHPFDPGFEKGFTLDEAINFPQEIKDKFNIDYIYDIVHKNSNNSTTYKNPDWDYNVSPIDNNKND